MLELLVQLKGKAGVVGDALPLLLNKVKEAQAKGVEELASFGKDDQLLLNILSTKLAHVLMHETVSFVEKAILDEAVYQLQDLMNRIDEEFQNPGPFFNIKRLSELTKAFNMPQSMSYIKNLLQEHEKPCADDDIIPIFVKVIMERGGT